MRSTPERNPQAPASTNNSIAAGAGVGAVHVAVTDGTRALDFYREILGLTPIDSDDGRIHMGAGGRELVVLEPGAVRPVVPRRTGLYHLAIVVPSRRELARVTARLSDLRWPQSPTDHVMTKADYLWDPDGNGIEVYAETPEDGTWGFDDRGGFFAIDSTGRARSGRDAIDLEALYGELAPDDRLSDPMPPGTRMGHVHLHVHDIDEAVHFYSDLVGFDIKGISHRLGMAFVSAGGYHHHVGLNTWAGEGALPPPEGSAGLRRITIELPNEADLDAVVSRMDSAGVEIAESRRTFAVQDPSKNSVRLQTG